MIKIEFPADNLLAARVFSEALAALASGTGAAKLLKIGDKCEGGDTASAALESNKLPDAAVITEMAQGHSPDARLDTKGVPFCDEYCAAAADPFYGSGARKGQWKKKRGVSDEAYDAWYASNTTGTSPVQEEQEEQEDHNPAAAAFGQQTAEEPKQDAPPPPASGGELMAWTAAHQTAETLTQADINDAFLQVRATVSDLFGPAAGEVVPSVYNILLGKIRK